MLTVGEVDSKGHLELREDPEAWIKDNPASRIASVTRLVLCNYEKEEIGEFIGELTQLIRLEFWCCRSLKCVSNTITRLHKLKHLKFFECYCLQELPANIGHLVSLTHLELYDCKNIKFLPDSIVNLSNLTSLTLFGCKSLIELPENIGQLASLSKLTSLYLENCDFLTELPSNLGQMKSLSHLQICNCNNIKSLPDSMKDLCSLDTLFIDRCNSLVELPANIGQLASLTHLKLHYCDNIKFLPDSIVNLSNLTSLTLFGCKSLVELPPNIGQLVSLTHLKLYGCRNIKSLPMSIANLSKLTSLFLEDCESLRELPSNLGQMKSLSHLQLDSCNKMKSLPDSMKDLCSLDTLFIKECNSLTQLPINLNVLHLELIKYCPHFLPTGLINLKYLRVTVCSCSDESFANLKNPYSLQHLYISGCCRHIVIKVPARLNQFVNLQVLSLHHGISFVELPANLDGLAHLCLLDIRFSRIKCLPWSITKLRKLQHLMLPEYFRLETLPYELNNSVIISVEKRHVRKSWEELKTEIGELPIPFGGEIGNDATPNPSIISPPGYLRLKEYDPSQWIINNRNLLMLVRFLDLKNVEELTDSIMQFSELTHLYLYITDHIRLPDNYFVTFTRLTHLSLHFSKVGIVESVIHSLSKLSNLQTLHLSKLSNLQKFNMPVSLKHLSLSDCNMRPLYDSLEKLTNLRSLDLNSCFYCESLPPCMYIHKLRLVDCSFKSFDSLPIGLHHLEILFFKYYKDLRCLFEKSWNKLVNLETLSISSSKMEFIPEDIARLHNLQKLQLKDCISLKKLPSNLHELVNLHTLDISITRIKILPPSFVNLHNLQHLILPKCFNFERLPTSLKQVSIIDDTEEAYYKSNTYDASLYQASASDESKDEVTELIVVPDEQTSADPFNSISMGSNEHITTEQGGISQIYKGMCASNTLNDSGKPFMEHSEPITSEQGAISQVYKDSQFDGRKDLINENSQYVACSLQNQFPSSGNDDFVTIFDDGFTTEQIFTTVTSENDRLPTNFNAGYRLKYNCSKLPPLIDLINTEHLDISLCVFSEELLATLKNSLSLGHLAIKDCKQQHHVKEFPANLNVFANLQTLFIQCSYIESLPSFIGLQNLQKLYIGGDRASRLKEFPADLDKLDKLLAVDIHDTKIKCLPWSVMMLQKLRFLFLPLDFRLETLPCQLNESVKITIDCLHIRKSWKELKREMRPSSLHGADMEVPQNSLILSPSGYLQLEDPGDWIQKNSDLCELVRSLELELADNIESIGDFIGELPNLTCLYISGSTCLNLKHLPSTSMALRHLSLQKCNIELLPDSFGKLSNLESLCLDTNLPANLDLLANLRCLYLQYGREQSLIDSMAKLTNLKALHLFECELDSLPETLNLDELKLSDCNIRSLPTGLGLCRHLEILHSKETCKNLKCDVTSLSLKQFVNVEKLSITCHSMEWLPNIEILQILQDLQLKDCSILEALPENLGNLVKLCTLDISGTRIKSLPDSITKLHNLQHLILPKCFQQDCSHKYPRQEFQVSVDDTFELYFNDMSYDVNDYESSIETSSDEQTLPHNLHAIQDRGDLCYNKGETSNPSGESSHAIQNTITTETEQGIALVCVTKEIDCGEINHHALESEQNHIPQSNNVGVKMNKNNITLETLQSFWSNHTKLEDAAEELGVSRSTLKRRIKELGVEWPRKGKKQQPDAKKRKHNNKAPFESDCSQQNLVNLGSSAAHAENVECIMGSDLHTLPNHVSSNSNVVINLTPDATMETIRGNLMETIDSHQGAEVHLNGANERTLSDTLPQNEKSSNFIVKAYYNDDIVRFDFSLSKSIDQLKEEIANQLELEVNTFKIKYQDEEKDLVSVTRISNLEHALNLSRSSNDSSVVRLLIVSRT